MWSDNDIDNAFRRLDPAEPEPTPFPLDGWLKLESQLDQAVIDRAVRRRLWQFFAAEVAVVALVGLGWSLWPAGEAASVASKTQAATAVIGSTRKASDRKRHLAATEALTTTVGQPPVNNAVSAMPISATALATATVPAAPMKTAAAAHAAGPVSTPSKPTRRLPLAAALVARPSFLPSTHSYLAGHRPAPTGVDAATVAVVSSRSAGTTADQQALSAAHSQITLAAGERAGVKLLNATTTDSGTEKTAPSADGATAAPARVAGEVVVADAASHSAGATVASTAARQSAVETSSSIRLLSAENGLATIALLRAEADQPAAVPLPAALTPVANEPLPLPAVVRQPRLYLGIVAAPDVSTVKFADVQAPRLNVGLTLEYRLSQRWRVGTGLQRANKSYYARRDDYDWTNYPRAQSRDFNWVEGQCTVLDVPLNLRYDAVVQARGRWFGTAGLSSFFMQRENYSYDYLESGTYKNWELPGLVNANRHFFSVLNLSAGYEYDLGPHWRLQAEPYAKVPLAGVGAGKVKLLSGGVYFGLKYGF